MLNFCERCVEREPNREPCPSILFRLLRVVVRPQREVYRYAGSDQSASFDSNILHHRKRDKNIYTPTYLHTGVCLVSMYSMCSIYMYPRLPLSLSLLLQQGASIYMNLSVTRRPHNEKRKKREADESSNSMITQSFPSFLPSQFLCAYPGIGMRTLRNDRSTTWGRIINKPSSKL